MTGATALWLAFSLGMLTFLWMYLGYPVALWLIGRWRGREVQHETITPLVSVIVCTYNEAQSIERRLRNLLASDYPLEQLEIIVVDSNSPDGTSRIVRSFLEGHPKRRVRLLEQESRKGKVSAINEGLAVASGDIVILTDAPAVFSSDTIRLIVQNFADSHVGAASGNFMKYWLEETSKPQETEWVVFSFRKMLRRLESRVDSMTWLSGELTAFRKALISEIPSSVIIDDAYIALAVRALGYRVVVDERAVYSEKRPTQYRETVTIKVKSVVGTVQEMVRFRKMLLNPHYGWYGFMILPARLLHFYLSPFILLVTGISGIALALACWGPATVLLAFAALAAIVLGLAVYRRGALFKYILAFLLVQWIIVLGISRYLTGNYSATWEQVSSTRS